MSDENFLARWSRRKAAAEQKAAAAERARDDNAPAENIAPPDDAGSQPTTPEHATGRSTQAAKASEPPLIDPKDLPPIDSISADTDISVFLRAGVPAELARAALRRAWATDPAIRDFIGLSENSWDFTAAHATPGFGPLSAEDARRLLAEFTDKTREMMDKLGTGESTERPGDRTQIQSEPDESGIPPSRVEKVEKCPSRAPDELEDDRDSTAASPNLLHRKKENVAKQHDEKNAAEEIPVSPRPHGSALPE